MRLPCCHDVSVLVSHRRTAAALTESWEEIIGWHFLSMHRECVHVPTVGWSVDMFRWAFDLILILIPLVGLLNIHVDLTHTVSSRSRCLISSIRSSSDLMLLSSVATIPTEWVLLTVECPSNLCLRCESIWSTQFLLVVSTFNRITRQIKETARSRLLLLLEIWRLYWYH